MHESEECDYLPVRGVSVGSVCECGGETWSVTLMNDVVTYLPELGLVTFALKVLDPHCLNHGQR